MTASKPSNPEQNPAATPDNRVSATVPVAPAGADATRKTSLELLEDWELDTADNKGFDPYNSGAFDFRHTWQKVTRK